MKKISLYVIVDYIFKFALLFTLNLVWSLYFFRTPWVSIILSVLFTLLVICSFKFLNAKKKKHNYPKLKEKQHLEDIKNTFIYLSNDKTVNFFYNLASTRHQVIKKDKYIEVVNNEKTILYPYFKIKEVTCDELIDIYNSIDKTKVKKIIILCNKYETNINSCLDNFSCKTIVLDYKQTYFSLLKPYEFYPEIIKAKPKTKSSFKQILLTAFNKKKTKGYVFSALFMLFASFFVVYKLYYLIVASILLIFAIICQFEFKFNQIPKEELL